MSESRDLVVMIAGATGLIGTELIKQMLEEAPITRIYALSRRPLPFFHPKLEVLENKQLQVQQWDSDKPSPKYGFICLGTTIKASWIKTGTGTHRLRVSVRCSSNNEGTWCDSLSRCL